MPDITDVADAVDAYQASSDIDDGDFERGISPIASVLGDLARADEAVRYGDSTGEDVPQYAREDRGLLAADVILAAVSYADAHGIDMADALETRIEMLEARAEGDEEGVLRARMGDEQYEDVAEQLRGTDMDVTEHDGVGFQ